MRKISIDKSNHFRAILTDTLPYEIPFFHTNEPLFHQVSSSAELHGFPSFVSNLLIQNAATKPFTYKVQKGGGAHRKLAIPHPAAQLKFAELYKHFDSFIENVCARSTYSLRFPTRVGSHFFQSQYATDQTPAEGVDSEPASFGSQRRWASSYFYYKQYSHIHKFFASQEFIRLEQKFALMLKIDISRCFESIYTHSIAWAIRGKEFGKDNRTGFFFESEFDTRMQNSNWGETNGILIGPEVSRIFAETIMQSIDVEIQRSLGDIGDRIAIKRYVDDFFIFSNSEDDLAQIKSTIEEVTSRYNLHINEKKTEIIRRPLTSSLSVARQRVSSLLKDLLKSAKSGLIPDAPQGQLSRRAADNTIAEIRRIARENGVDYATLASPALAIVARGAHQIRQRTGAPAAPITADAVEVVVLTILRIATFLFLMDIRSATAHKLAKIFLECSLLNEKLGEGRMAFEGAVLDTVRLALEQARLRKIKGPEIINVLVAADAVCRTTKGVTEDSLRSAFGIDGKWEQGVESLNYFELVATLYFSRNRHAFHQARTATIREIGNRILLLGPKLKSHTEETFLFFDFLSCPYIEEGERILLYQKVAAAHGNNAAPATSVTQFKKISKTLFFTAWEGAEHFQAMLERRELQPAYDS